MKAEMSSNLAGNDGPTLSRRGFHTVLLTATSSAVAQRELPRPIVPLALSEAVDLSFLDPLMTLIEDAAHLRWERRVVPFARMLRSVEQGEAIGFGISPNEKRRETMLFSRPVFRGAVWAVSRRDRNLDVRRVADLRGLTVCQSRLAAYGDELAAPAAFELDVQQVAGDLSRRMTTLQTGHCDVLLVTSRNASVDGLHVRLRTAGGDLQAFRSSRRPLVEQDVQFAVAKGSALATHLSRIDAAVRTQRAGIQELLRD